MMIGLSAYPSDNYYDPQRPAWVPYWLDTPTESAMKWGAYPGASVTANYPNPPKPQAPGVPAGGYTGAVTDTGAVDSVVRASADAYRSDVSDTFRGVANALDAQGAADSSAAMNRVVLLAAVGIAVLIFTRR